MPRPRSDIQPRIVHAARARFLESGVDGASLRAIASDAGTNVGMIFYYFPTKDDLFLAVIEEVYVKLLDDLAAALAGDAPVRERLERVFARIGRASEDEVTVVRLVVREALLSHERFGRVFARMQRGHVGMILSTLAEGISRGEIDAGIPPPLLLLSCIGLGAFPQLVRRAAGDRAPFSALPDPDKLAHESGELLFRAIGATRTREPVPARRPRPKRRTAVR
ncbi:MAG TPA: TetR/AcrR family transcriptional regulator [Polyangiaceae bacterium]